MQTRAAPSRHDARINSFVVTFTEPIVWLALVDALEMLTSLRGENLLRIKGIVNVEDEPLPRVIHAVQHTIYPAATLSAWPNGDRNTRLVFITRDIDEASVRQTLASFVAETTTA
jgi:G3E family GTPase